MRFANVSLSLVFMLCLSSICFPITKEEVITLAKLGIGPDEIIKAIEKDKTVFDLKIQDILELKKAGVPDDVIKFMLKTKEKFGGPSKPAEGVTPPTAPTPQVREKTPEEIKAEEERQREEARKLAEEAKKAEEARRKAYAGRVMRKGLMLAEKGEWVEAIETFQKFISEGGYGPGTDEFYQAKFGIASALINGKLYQSGAKLLVEVLLEGPDKPFFKEAFLQLRALRKEIIYSPPDLEQLTKFFIGNFSQQFQDEFNYVLGEFFYDYGNYQRALKHFDAISDSAPDKARALYLTGLVQVRYKMFKSAVETFEKAIDITEKNKSDQSVIDLAYMALARIAFEAGSYDAAVFYYKKVPKESVRWPTVLYELAWTYLMKGDYSRSLGTFHVLLHSPYFSGTFFPELWILEARVYNDLCRYEQARKALDMFDHHVLSYHEQLRRFINAQRSPEDFYKNFVASMNGEKIENPLPREISYPVKSNVEFYNVYRTIRQIEKEQALVEKNRERLGNFAAEMLVKLAVLRKDRMFECGVKIQQILKELDATIGTAQEWEKEIDVDIDAAAIERMTRETRKLVGEYTEEEETGKKREHSIAIVGGDTEVWAFQGDYWMDETLYFRGMLTSLCQQ